MLSSVENSSNSYDEKLPHFRHNLPKITISRISGEYSDAVEYFNASKILYVNQKYFEEQIHFLNHGDLSKIEENKRLFRPPPKHGFWGEGLTAIPGII